MRALSPAFLTLVWLTACASSPDVQPRGSTAEGRSLLGLTLERRALEEVTRERLELQLATAEALAAAEPESEEAAIWLGRRLAYLGRYQEAIAAFSTGLDQHPESYRLLRHRGHRLITLRQFDAAVSDLRRASLLARATVDRYEPDGAPNSAGIPRSTTRSNIAYHLGLAHYLAGDFQAAHDAWREGWFFAQVNDDMAVAMLYWRVLACWKLGLTREARDLLATVKSDLYLLENHGYHRLLLFFKDGRGEQALQAELERGDLESATLAHGLAAWHLSHGAAPQAQRFLRLAISGESWAAFGFIAAEAELARAGGRRR
jgi:tetratricopeptide (TPR) repeat protein